MSLAQLQEDLEAVEEAIRRVVAGEMVKEVWRDGRRIVRENPSYETLIKQKATLERLIEQETHYATYGRRRRPIRLLYK